MTANIVTLRDDAAGTEAQILVSLGFNCFRFTAQCGGRPVEVLYSHPNFASGNERPSGSGIPLLFPYPGRLPGMAFEWEGKTYAQEAADPLGNAIHGFVLRRPWRVIEQTATRVSGQFHAWRDDPSLKERWPSDFRITATYTLAGNALASEFLIENPGDLPLPCGFGTHPYFRVPLGGHAADDCRVRLPVSAQWEIDQMLPTGQRLPLANATEMQAGKRFGELQLDNAFTGLVDRVASIEDPASGCRMSIQWDEAFRECVVYTPPHREAICIEPLSCAPSAAMLASRGIDAGWKVLPSGASVTARVTMAVNQPTPVL
jgi:aldose 1-epimerase